MAKRRQTHRPKRATWIGFKPYWIMQVCIVFGKQSNILNWQWFYIFLPSFALITLIILTIAGIILIRLFCR